jgi:sialic acid synthase SpsE
MEGPDHKASLDPLELKEMVKAIRNIENALGSEVKMPSPSETKNIAIARKSIHIAFDLEKDSVLTYDNLISKRPGDGISPMHIDEVVGKKIKLALPQDHKLSFADFE